MPRYIIWTGNVAIALLWGLLAPIVFLYLYVIIEMQIEAKAELKDQPGIPTIFVGSHFDQLQSLDRTITNQSVLVTEQAKLLSRDNAAYVTAKNALIADLIDLAAQAEIAQDFGKCHTSGDETIGCHDSIVLVARNRLRHETPQDRPMLEGTLKRTDEHFATFLNLRSQTQNELDVLNAARATLNGLQKKQEALIGPADGKLKAVTDSYSEVSGKLPGFGVLFMIPEGAVVATFTGLMGAIGAAVFSLYGRLRPGSPLSEEALRKSYGTRPLLGALAGFMVYFVISAGAAFLVQPQANVSTAVNGLAPAALASLGLFAGIAADNALRWLSEQAARLFKSGEPERRAVQKAGG
ncbi:MAG: hypothetical protein ACJ798_06755 [Phenylobacterium sp.]